MSLDQSRMKRPCALPTLRIGRWHANIGRRQNIAHKNKACALREKPNEQAAHREPPRRKLRSSEWFNNPHNPGMTALYLERYLNYGLTRQELQSGKPIIGIAQTGNDLSPCNRHHLELAHRVREGIRAAGGIAMEFPTHPIQETGKRPDRGARPQPRLSRPGRNPVRLSAGWRGADHRLRQDHAGLPDGGCDGQHAGHRAVGRTDAERLA